MTPLFSTAYFPPIAYMAAMARFPKVEVEDEDEDISPDVQIEVPKKRRTRSASKKEDPEEEVKKEKEDLFNLIDNMYSEDEEEEDE